MTKYKILVVDDEESLCEILQFNLEVEGYEVDVAYSAEQALGMHPERYSLILLDVMMGEMSGFKMARLLRAQPETAGVPIIFCTAKDTEDDTVAGLHMDLVRKICTVDGAPLALTKKEFEILALLLSNRGKIFSREEILHQVWSDEVIVLDRTIDVNITRLRRKIGVYGEHIVTRLGYGYGFEE